MSAEPLGGRQRALRGAVFDLDGTVADNMAWHARAWVALARKLGSSATEHEFIHVHAGKKNEEILPFLLGRAIAADEARALAEEKEAAYRALYGPHLVPVAGLQALLDELRAAGVRLAVASAAPAANRAFLLDGLRIREFFSVIVGAEDAARGKPAPDMFLAAARKLEVPPEGCLAFEDALNGVRAAVAAGMACVGVSTTASEADLRAAGARLVVPDFTRLPADLGMLVAEG